MVPHALQTVAGSCPGADVDQVRIGYQPFPVYLAQPRLAFHIIGEVAHHGPHVRLHACGGRYAQTGGVGAVVCVLFGDDLRSLARAGWVVGVKAVEHHRGALLAERGHAPRVAEVGLRAMTVVAKREVRRLGAVKRLHELPVETLLSQCDGGSHQQPCHPSDSFHKQNKVDYLKTDSLQR